LAVHTDGVARIPPARAAGAPRFARRIPAHHECIRPIARRGWDVLQRTRRTLLLTRITRREGSPADGPELARGRPGLESVCPAAAPRTADVGGDALTTLARQPARSDDAGRWRRWRRWPHGTVDQAR